jgi:hypothetical protein
MNSSMVSSFFGANGVVGATISTDGSGLTLTASGSTSVICQAAPCPTIVDTGGNTTANNNNVDPLFRGTVASYTDPAGVALTAYFAGDTAQTVIYNDSLGSVVLTASETDANSVPPNGKLPTNSYRYTSANGTVQTYVVKYGQFYQSTNFGCTDIAEVPRTPVFLPIQVITPTRDTYVITYENTPGNGADVTGRIASVTYPTGGTVHYQYSGTNNGINCEDGSVPTMTVTAPDGGVWTYIHTLN